MKKLIIVCFIFTLASCGAFPTSDTLSEEEIRATAAIATDDRAYFLTREAELFPTITPSVEVVIPDFLVEKTCKAPCILGITPEKTLVGDVNSILSERFDDSPCKAPREEDLECFLEEYGYMSIGSDLNTGLVDAIGYMPFPPMHLGGVIANYGEPDFLFANRPEHHDWTYVTVSMYYSELQTIIYLEVRGRVLETSEITQIVFLDKKWYKNFLEIEMDGYHPQLPWEGYGEYPP